MLRNYLTVAWRALRRNPTYTAINVGGLALGLACCVLIALYVQDELSYDDFHENADRLIFVGKESPFGGELNRGMSAPYPLAGALEREVPSVERAIVTLWPGSGEVSRGGEDFVEEEGIFHVGEGFFELFSFPLVKGKAVLSEPNTTVISEALAEKYFPGENPVGQMLRIKERGDHEYRVTGVARIPGKSYLDFNAVLSMATTDYPESHGDTWRASMFLTFAELSERASLDDFEKQAASLNDAHYGEDSERRFFAQPITGLYLSDLVSVDGFRGERRYLYIFGAVALFILLLACVNYVNLSTARSAQRAKEVGVRRTVGAGRFQVARQFLGESVLMTLAAFVLSLVLARAALPVFNHLTDKELALFAGHAGFMALLFAAALVVGVVAGAYPALYLSGFRPTEVLRGGIARGKRGARLRKGLVILQFAVAVALIAATAVVYQQLRYTQQKDLGFAEEQVVNVSIRGAREQAEAVKRAFLQHPAVKSTSANSGVPGSGYNSRYGFVPDSTRPDESMFVHPVNVDADYLQTLGMNLTAGRFFSSQRATDDTSAYILNEAAVQKLGWENPVGHEVTFMNRDGTAIGVVENFHFQSFREEIAPVVFQVKGDRYKEWPSYSQVAVRFAPGQTEAVLDHLETQWAQFSEEPLDYTFLNEQFAEMYRTERRLGQVFTAFAVVAVLIACLGLYGLAAFAAERRSKEIAIRKTFGASARQIVTLLSKQFLLLVAVGFALAVPASWYVMQRWLQDFAYRIDLSPWLFAAAGLAALVVAMGATSWQALRAARTNPAQALRDE